MTHATPTTAPSQAAPPATPTWGERVRAARWVWVPLLVFLVTRIGVMLVAYLAVPLLPENDDLPTWHSNPDNTVVDALSSRWDTGFYLSIASEGYIYHDVVFPSVAFFPLLPLFMRLTMLVVRSELLAGLLVANGALLLASFLFYRLVAEEWGDGTAERAVWYLLIFPVSFFGSAIYSESLFLLCAIGALYFARKGYWESAGMLGFLAALTRLVGVIVAPMLLVEWWAQRRHRPPAQRPGWRALLAPLVTPLGTLAYVAFLWYRFGEPLAFVRASARWAREPQPMWQTVQALLMQPPVEGWGRALLAGRLPLDNWLDLLFVLFFFMMGLVLLRQRRWSEAVFVLLGLLLPMNSGMLMSQRRYVWVLFPVFILLARWGERAWVDRLVTVISLVLLGFFTALFANWYWVA